MELRPRRRAAVALAAVLALLTGACGKGREPQRAAPDGIIRELEADSSVTTDVNARSPAFVRTDFAGNLVRTQDAIGSRVLLLDFWSVFCESCLREMPFLKGLHEKYADAGLQIVGVNTDFFPRERIEGFMEKTGLALPYPLIHDRDQSLAELFSVEALPVLVLIDSEGWIRMVHLGYRPADEGAIEARVRRAVRGIREAVVTLQPVAGKTSFAPPEPGRALLAAGTAVGDFAALDASGAPFAFAAWRDGSPALVFFWSVFCQPCRREFAHLAAIAERPSVAGLQVLAVNIDVPKLKPAALRTLASEGRGLAGVFDRPLAGGRLEVAERFGVGETPSTFLVGADGLVRQAWSGEVTGESLRQALAALAEASPAAGPPGGRP